MENLLYVMESCPGCTVVKTRLGRHPNAGLVKLRWVDRDPSAAQELRALGSRSVPTLRGSDGRVYVNPNAIIAALGI